MAAQETLGTARVDIVLDTDQLRAEVVRSKTLVSSMGPEFEKTFGVMSASQKRATTQALQLAQQTGMTREEIRLLSLSARGAAPEAIEKLRQAMVRERQEMEKGGISAKAYTAAMRGVPAQITDIAVSLQGGQRPLTVLLQQGGQLKDMFGGIVPATKALASSLVGLINPYTIVAAAAGTLAYAWYDATQEGEAYTKVVATAGRVTGVTAAQLATMTAQVAETQNVTTSSAREAVLAVASSGKVAVENMEAVAAAAVSMQELTGQSIDKTISDYGKLRDEPTKAVMELNSQLGFLTLATYDRIRSLEEQGRNEEAAAIATRAAADATEQALQKVRDNLNWLSKGWKEVRADADAAWQGMKGSLGLASRTDEMNQLVAQNKEDLKTLQDGVKDGLSYGWSYQYESAIKARSKRIKEIAAELIKGSADAQVDAARSAATTTAAALDSIIDANASKEEKKRREVAKVVGEADVAIRKAQAAGLVQEVEGLEARKAKALAAIEEKYKDKKTASTAGATRSAGLQGYKDDLVEERAQIAASTKTLQAQYQAREITAEDYYTKLRELTQQGTDAEAESLRKQIAYLEAQSVKGKDAINVNKQISQLESQLAKVRLDGAAAQDTLSTQERAAIQAREQAVKSYRSALEASTQALQDEMDAMIARVGIGDREYEIQQKINDVYREQARRLNELALARQQNPANADALDREEADLRAETARRVSVIKTGYDQLAVAQADWSNGTAAAWSNYADDAANTAAKVQSLWGDAFSGAEDLAVKFVKAGKLSASDLIDSILEDLTRLGTSKALTALLGSVTGGGGTTGSLLSLFSGSWGFAKGGVFDAPDLKQYVNTLVSKPTTFAFASGGVPNRGLMGEAGTEAIMPLTRTASGKLGVESVGGGAGQVNVSIEKGASRDAVQTSRGADGSINIKAQVRDAVRGLVASGDLDGVFGNRYGVAARGNR